MLLSRRRNPDTTPHDPSTVHNYYERLVTEAILQQDPRATSDFDYMDDTSCVALNHLPPRYIRHGVDMSFYLSPIELEEITTKVSKAVKHAIEFVKKREQVYKAISDDDQKY
ncbi:MAG: hypothetical protein ACJAUP_001921 [Cellvibrionaceae bacterium]|jgi:hypothetical protein